MLLWKSSRIGAVLLLLLPLAFAWAEVPQEPHPLTPSLSPTGGEGVRRTGEGDSRSPNPPNHPSITQFSQWLHSPRAREAMPVPDSAAAEGERLAKARRAEMKRLMLADPQTALAVAVPPEARERLPAQVRQHVEDRVSGRGDLEVQVADDFDRGTCEVRREVRLNGQRYQAAVHGRRLGQRTEQNVPLHGIALDGVMAVEEPVVAGDNGGASGGGGEPPVARSSWTQGYKRVLFLRVIFPDDVVEPISEDAAYVMMDQVNQWYGENSYDTLWLVADVTPLLLLPQTKDSYSTTGAGSLLLDARTAAREAGFDTDNYDFDIVRHNRVPGSAFNWNGLAYVGGKGVWLQTSSAGVAVHELGHNLGLWHANSWSASGDSVIGPGSNVEYGNTFDTMGPANAGVYQFNACFKNLLDWLPWTEVQTVQTSGVYRLYAYDVAQLVTGQAYALRVEKDAYRSYWLEFRQKFSANRWTQNGVLLNWSPWDNGSASSASGTHLLDTFPGTPTGNSSKDDAPVVMGRTFSDSAAGIHLTPLAKGDDSAGPWMDVQVNVGLFPSNTAPVLEITADQTSVLTNVAVQFAATASDADSDNLAYYWDFGDLTFGSNAPASTKSWFTNGEYLVRCTVTDLKGGVSSRQLVVTVGEPGTYRLSGRITNAVGQPIEGVRVHNGLSGAAYRGAYTDSDGNYVLAGLPAGTNILSAVKYGWTFARSGWANPVVVGPDVSGLDWLASASAVVTVVASDAVAAEPNGGTNTATFTLRRTGSLATSLTVKFVLTGTAWYLSDYTFNPVPTKHPYELSYWIVLPAGMASTDLTVVPLADAEVEAPETAILTLLEDAAYVLGGPSEATATLLDSHAAIPPEVNVLAFDDLATESGGDSGVFLFWRVGDLSSALEVYYTVTGTASNGVDYTALPGTVILAAGQRYALVTLEALDDAEVEGDETVVVTLLTNAAYTLGVLGSATLVIGDNDPPMVTIVATDNQARESGGNSGRFTVTRAGSFAVNLLVNYVLSGTASNGVDYTLLSGSVLIPAGQATASFTVSPINDSLVEGNETVVATLASSSACNVGNPAQAVVTLIDDESPAVSLSVTDANAAEPGTDTGAFTFTRTGSTTGALTVYFDVYGTAVPGVDYIPFGNSVVISAGTNSAVLTVTPLDDFVRETNETLTLLLRPDVAYSINTTTPQTVTIADNDENLDLPSVTVSSPDDVASEPGTNTAEIVFTRTGSTNAPLTVYFELWGEALNGADFAAISNSIVIPAGTNAATLTITPLDDSVREYDEMVGVSVLAAPGYFAGPQAYQAVTILDNDAEALPGVGFVSAAFAGGEPEPWISLDVLLSADSTNTVSVDYAVTGGTAEGGVDYVLTNGTLVFPPGETYQYLSLEVMDDTLFESNETIVITLSNPTNALLDAIPNFTYTILDDDGEFMVTAPDATASETGPDPGVFRITRVGLTNEDVTVFFQIAGSAAKGIDFTCPAGPVLIPAGERSVDVVVTPIDDATDEPVETVVLTLLSASIGAIGPGNSATITLADNDTSEAIPIVRIAASDPVAAEWGLDPGEFRISRDRETNTALTVDFTVSGSAGSGVDFDALGTSITIPPGADAAALPLRPRDDAFNEGPENVIVTLTARAGCRVDPQAASARTTIVDDEATPPATITQHPHSRVVTVGSNAVFSVGAAGAQPLLYQWFLNSTNPLPGATNASLVLTNVQDADAGNYSVQVSNWTAVLSSNALLVVNHPPVVRNDDLGVTGNQARAVARDKLLLNDTDADGDPLTVSDVSATSTNGGTLVLAGADVIYTPVTNYVGSDLFIYTASDGRGGTAIGTVLVTVWNENDPSVNRISQITVTGEGVVLRFAGIPGFTYTIERSTDLESWTAIDVVIAPANGLLVFTDATPPAGTAFYRTVSP